MRKQRSLAAIAAATLFLLAACGSGSNSSGAAPGGDSSSSAPLNLTSLVAAAQKEGSVTFYTDLLQQDTDSLQAAWKKAYPGITLNIQTLSGTSLISRFESEAQAGAPSADVISTASIQYPADAASRGLVVPLEQSGVLGLLPNYPKQYISDDLDTALINVVESGFLYNTSDVPADKVPTSWQDLTDPFWKGHIVAGSFAPPVNTNWLEIFDSVAKQYGEDTVQGIANNIGDYEANFQNMQASVASGENWLAIQSLPFVAAGMKAQGAPVAFTAVPPYDWPVHGVNVTTHAQHPNAAKLLAYFLLSPTGSEAIRSGEGDFSPYDKGLPADFKMPTLDNINDVTNRASSIMAPFPQQ